MLIARLLAPYLAVGVCWLLLRDAWLTVLFYHLQIILWSRGRPWPDLRACPGWSRRWLLAAAPCVLAGPALLVVMPWAASVELGAWLAGFGLSGTSLALMVPYYGLVHPLLEQRHWGPLRRRTPAAHVVFAAYHMLVLGSLLRPGWLVAVFGTLVAASVAWGWLDRRSGNARAAVLGHMVADLGTVLVAWWWVAWR